MIYDIYIYNIIYISTYVFVFFDGMLLISSF